MRVAVLDFAREEHERIVEQIRAVSFLGLFHALQEVGVLGNFPRRNRAQVRELLRIVLVVRDLVVRAFHAQERVVPVAAGVVEHEGHHAGHVAAECRHYEIKHHLDVGLVVERLGWRAARLTLGRDRLLETAQSRQVFIELAFVRGAGSRAHPFRVARHVVEDAALAASLQDAQPPG